MLQIRLSERLTFELYPGMRIELAVLSTRAKLQGGAEALAPQQQVGQQRLAQAIRA